MQIGGDPAEAFASALRMRNAPPSQSEKALVFASAHGNLGNFAVARQMRRLFGPRGTAVRQQVLAATNVDVSLDDDDVALWLARRKTKKLRADKD